MADIEQSDRVEETPQWVDEMKVKATRLAYEAAGRDPAAGEDPVESPPST